MTSGCHDFGPWLEPKLLRIVVYAVFDKLLALLTCFWKLLGSVETLLGALGTLLGALRALLGAFGPGLLAMRMPLIEQLIIAKIEYSSREWTLNFRPRALVIEFGMLSMGTLPG